jgi:hypothetical protein
MSMRAALAARAANPEKENSMDARSLIAAAAAAGMMAITVSLFAADQPAAGAAPKSEPIYGYRMMDDQERNEYRARMRNAGSEHRKLMEGRAKERGVTLPAPRGPGDGKGPGYGPGPRGDGKGPGYGAGPQGMGKGPGYGPGPQGMGKGPGYGPGPQGMGKGPGYGPGPQADCPAGQDCPGPGAGKGPGPRP